MKRFAFSLAIILLAGCFLANSANAQDIPDSDLNAEGQRKTPAVIEKLSSEVYSSKFL